MKYKVKPKPAHRIVLGHYLTNGNNWYQAIKAAGYSDVVAKTPTKITKSKGFLALLDEAGVTDEKLFEVLKEGLSATKPIYKNNNATKKVELVNNAPDHPTRHKYLETGLRLRGHKEDKPSSADTYNTFIQQNNINPNAPKPKALVDDTLDMLMKKTSRKVIDL